MPEKDNKTKVQTKKAEKKLKGTFINCVYKEVLAQVLEQTVDNRSGLKVCITFRNCNRYIMFDAVGRSLNIQIRRDGNVVVDLEEFCHQKYTEVLFEYISDERAQEKFLVRIKNVSAMLINEFMEKSVLNWHSYMDYVVYEKNVVNAYEKMVSDYPEDCDE